MTPYPKRLIEVDLPIRQISEHARREKSIRHGHISTLHIWWARRPLAACRAVTCAALWPDPADELCPQAFRNAAAGTLGAFAAKVRADRALAALSKQGWSRWNGLAGRDLQYPTKEHWLELRGGLLDFIADFANWDASTVPAFLETSRALTQAAHEALGGAPGTRPLVVDPFAGGGSIPLEALRVGADAFASDLNPVAVLLNKVVLEYIPKYGQRLADEVRKWGAWVKKEAEKELAQFYPKDPDGATPIAYLWARTIRCEGPGCGAEVPLVRSPWLSQKPDRPTALSITGCRNTKEIIVNIESPQDRRQIGAGTVKGGAATCPVCAFTTPVQSVRAQLRERRGGVADSRLLCVVTTHVDRAGRSYRRPTDVETLTNVRMQEWVSKSAVEHVLDLSPIPDESLPPRGTLGFRVQNYGVLHWGDLFTPRQQLALAKIAHLIRRVGIEASSGSEGEFGSIVQLMLCLAFNRLVGRMNALCWWRSQADQEKIEVAFTGQTVPMKWDFAEGCPLTNGTAGWTDAVAPILRVIEGSVNSQLGLGVIQQNSAAGQVLPDDAAHAYITDPPYYDAVPYASLSDFFYVWLRRTLPASELSGFQAPLAPKGDECIVDDAQGKDRLYFEELMRKSMAEGRRVLMPHGIGVVVFAHKSTAGWEAQLQGMVQGGWIITGSWPIDTEMQTRVRARNSAALASSIHLVCRPREDDYGQVAGSIGDWRSILQELPRRIHEWMPHLAAEGVVGADAIFACLGPALEIFSRYSRVEKASGEQVTLKEYLEEVWAAVAREALNMLFDDADAHGFEPDARLTAMWLWTLSASATNGTGSGGDEAADEASDDEEESERKSSKKGGYTLEYDAARKIAQGLGADLGQLGALVEVKGDKARLLPVSERLSHLFETKQKAPKAAKRGAAKGQGSLFEAMGEAIVAEPVDGGAELRNGATVLDRVHQSMLLFGAGRSEGLKRFLVDDGIGRDERFWRLSQSLSALYPPGSEEKRWIDGVLARKKGLGF